ncbi:uncharacterized protein DDB_G0271670-like [Eriocheir sinensis]|uniref:uncharacterized protein DDB_G0271670-like n=1 Tax=Eriocheir sinensis TaxID=95602 RepID=UPI0021CA050C|nr:uncharacterized protein DDB_G0271670-like [Eriocheir sinensis]
MPADAEVPVVGVRGAQGVGRGQLPAKTSSRASLSSVTTATPSYSSSSSSVSSEVTGQMRSSDSLSSVGSPSPAPCEPADPSQQQPAAIPASVRSHFPPSTAATPAGGRDSPEETPTVTISRFVEPAPPPAAASSPASSHVSSLAGQSSSSSSSSSSNSSFSSSSSCSFSSSSSSSYSSSPQSSSSPPPPLDVTTLVASICTSQSPPTVTPSISLAPASLSQLLPRGYSPTAARLVRTSPPPTISLTPSPVPRRFSDVSSGSEHLAGSSRPRAPSLALTHLSTSDITVPPCLHSPPPSYDQLCNPNALPTYQEATQSSSDKHRRGAQRTVFTLSSGSDAAAADPLVQDGERGLGAGLRGGMLASLAAELSDSEGGYSTILDAIPHEHQRDPCATVPIRFLQTCSLRRLRPPKLQPPCLTSVCNKALVRKELNRRWPFIAAAREDDQCPGLLLVECSSHLTVAHLPEPVRSGEGGSGLLSAGGLAVGSGGDLGSLVGDNFTDLPLGSPTLTSSNAAAAAATAAIDLESGALTSQVLFYLCGKCVGYDSFDIDNVRSHIEYDCAGPQHQWGSNAELYLVLRAVLFVVVIIFVFVWLPYLQL